MYFYLMSNKTFMIMMMMIIIIITIFVLLTFVVCYFSFSLIVIFWENMLHLNLYLYTWLFRSKDLICSSHYCLPYITYEVSSENLVLDQLTIH